MATEPSPSGNLPVRSRLLSFSRAVAGCLLGVVLIGCLVWFTSEILDGIQKTRNTRNHRDDKCLANLRQIAVAIQQYHDFHGCFPPAYFVDEAGTPVHSWRVLVLPFLGYQELYDQYRFDEPWDGEHNRKLLDKMPSIYRCPEAADAPPGTTDYVAVIGARTVWPAHYSTKRSDITAGTSNCPLLLEIADANVPWFEPRDVLYEQLRHGFAPHHPDPHHATRVRAVTVSEDPVSLPRDMPVSRLRAFLAAAYEPFPGVDCPKEVERARVYRTEPISATDLKRTEIVPHLAVELTPGRNLVYCASFQMVWDKLVSEVVGAPIELEGDPALARVLNQGRFPLSSLADDCYLAWAGIATEDAINQLRQQLQERFPAGAGRLLPAPDPDALLAYAYFFKRLTFARDFDRLKEPMHFRTSGDTAAVLGFGIQDFTEEQNHLRIQVKLLDYVSDDDFILRLVTDSDSLVLAKIPRSRTLSETVSAVRQRIAAPLGSRLGPLDVDEPLSVPIISLFVQRSYPELQRPIRNRHSAGLWIASAEQLIRFQLDESGVILDTETGGVVLGEEELEPPKPRRFVFDRPFLVLLRQSDTDEPYLAIWVENDEILVPFHEE
ncbi:MAG: DUF1559 domain-containing protein [Pirellulaceae bacterium]|nr:DUF1559 domain-containing protein [Pirellulaceae bacterium]